MALGVCLLVARVGNRRASELDSKEVLLHQETGVNALEETIDTPSPWQVSVVGDGALATEFPAQNEASEPSFMREDHGEHDGLRAQGEEFLRRIDDLDESVGLDNLTTVEGRQLQREAFQLHSQLVVPEFDRLYDAGLFESRRMLEPVSSGELDELYDCAYSWTSDDPDQDGFVIVEVVVYPRDQYPLINDLLDLAQRLGQYFDPRQKESESK